MNRSDWAADRRNVTFESQHSLPQASFDEVFSRLCANGAGPLPAVIELLEARANLSRLLESSYIHPNGFFKIPLFESDYLGPKIRLHVWIPHRLTPSAIDTNIHTHHWSFDSFVMAGSLRHITYLEARGTSYNKCRLSRRPSNGHVLHTISKCELHIAEERQIGPNASYSLKATEIHQLFPSIHDRVTATLILQHRHTEYLNHVYLPASVQLEESEIVPTPITEEDISAVIAELHCACMQ